MLHGKALCRAGEQLIRHHHRFRALVHHGTRHDLLHCCRSDRLGLPLALNGKPLPVANCNEVNSEIAYGRRHGDHVARRPHEVSDMFFELDSAHSFNSSRNVACLPGKRRRRCRVREQTADGKGSANETYEDPEVPEEQPIPSDHEHHAQRADQTPSIATLLGRWFWWPLNVRTRPASQMLQPYGSCISVRELLGHQRRPATGPTETTDENGQRP